MPLSISDLSQTEVVARVRSVFGRRFLAVVLAGVMVLGGGLVVFVAAGSTGVSAQGTTPAPLDESECRTGGYLTDEQKEVLDEQVEECKLLVRIRNHHVLHPASVLTFSTFRHQFLDWGKAGEFINCATESCRWGGVTLDSRKEFVTGLDFKGESSAHKLAGEIQATELCRLTRLKDLRLHGNSLSGQIPECLGGLVNLETLTLRDNQLSGSIPASIAQLTNLHWFSADNNALTGSLPAGFNAAFYLTASNNSLSGNLPADLGRTDGYTVILDLSDNDFDGAIPSAWTSRFTKINIFSLANNRLSGAAGADWINDWINAIEFVDTKRIKRPVFSLEGNQICYSSAPALTGNQPRSFDSANSFTGDYMTGGDFLDRPVSLDTNSLNSDRNMLADFRLANQTCLFGQQSYSNLLMPGITNPVSSFAATAISASWPRLPSADGVSYTPTTYLAEFTLNTDIPGAINDNGCFQIVPVVDPQGLTPAHRGEVPLRITVDPTREFQEIIRPLFSDGQSNFGLSLTTTINNNDLSFSDLSFRVGLTGGPLGVSQTRETVCRAMFGRYFIDAIPLYEVSQGNLAYYFKGDNSREGDDLVTVPGWRAFNVTAAGAAKDASQIARDLGVPEDDSMYSWDAPNQAWVAHSAVGSSGTLAAGTAVIFQEGVATEAELAAAGVGRADEDIVLTLYQGWNLMAPELLDVDNDGEADDFDDRSQAATLFDEASLSDCGNTLGLLALVTYDLLTESFNLFLPCLDDVSVPGYGQLSEIDRADSLFVFFQSQLPVPVTWDPVTQQYTPNI